MERAMASSTTGGGGGGGGSGIRKGGMSSREGSAKAIVSEQISQSLQSTSNLLHLFHHSSPSLLQLTKLHKNLLSKASTINNTHLVLEQMPRVISSLDAHMDNGLQSVPHLRTVIQLLSNMESCQLSSLSNASISKEEETKSSTV